MQTQIEVLPPLLANQIAAGEVIERPASVLKELLENSIDAKAQHIDIELLSGGLSLIMVQDDGLGIVKDDLPKALLRHATSKIKTTQDLMNIGSMGFRGEALASIAACAKLTLSSRPSEEVEAFQCVLKGYALTPELKPCALEKGTRVEIRDLFYNIPARRKFLKSAKTELQHCMDVVNKCALAHPELYFKVTHNRQEIKRYPLSAKESLDTRIKAVCAKHFIENAYAIHQNAMNLSLWGYLGTENLFRRTPDWQYFYVNQRPVKDKLILHAIKSVYHEAGFDLEGLYPSYVLFLTLPFDEVDVNVHPTKHEVRFIQSGHIHDFIKTSLQSALHAVPLHQAERSYAMPLNVVKPQRPTPTEDKHDLNLPLPAPIQEAQADRGQPHPWFMVGQSLYLFSDHQKMYAIDLLQHSDDILNEFKSQWPEYNQPKPLLVAPKFKGKLQIPQEVQDFGFTIRQNIQNESILTTKPQFCQAQDMDAVFQSLIQRMNGATMAEFKKWLIDTVLVHHLSHPDANSLHHWLQSQQSWFQGYDPVAVEKHLKQFFKLGIETKPQFA